MANTDERPYVFIAYSTHEDDIPVVEALERLLKEEGFTTFRDKDARSGVDYQVELDEKLNKATVVLACWSHTALQERYHLRSEAEWTIGKDKRDPLPTGEPRYLPIGINGFTRDDLPLGMNRFQMRHKFHDWERSAEADCYQDLRNEIDERLRKASDLRRGDHEPEDERPLERRLCATFDRTPCLEMVEREKGDAGWPVFCVRGTSDDSIPRLAEHLMIRQDNDGYQALREHDRIGALQALEVNRPMQARNYEREFLSAIDAPTGLDAAREKLAHWFASGGWPVRVVCTCLEYEGDPRLLQDYAREARRIGDQYAGHFPRYRVYFLFGAVKTTRTEQGAATKMLQRLRRLLPDTGVGGTDYVDLGELDLIRDRDIEPWRARIRPVQERYRPVQERYRLDAVREQLGVHDGLDLINGVRYQTLDPILRQLLIAHRKTGTPQ